jgi:hypothetical protein
MNREALTAERGRFAKVMATRTNTGELLELFQKLEVSDKFSEEAKLYCYGDLIETASRRVSDAQVQLLMQAVEQSGAAKKARAVMSDEEGNAALMGLVARAFTCAPREEAPLMAVFLYCERVGITPERGFTVGLAIEAGMAIPDLDEILDLTHDAYYPTFAGRRALAAA